MQALGWSIGAVCVSAIDDAGTKLCKGDRGKVVGPGTSAGGDAAQRVLVDYGGKGQINVLAKEQIITMAEYERQQAAAEKAAVAALGLLQPLEALSLDADTLRAATVAAVAYCDAQGATSFADLVERASMLIANPQATILSRPGLLSAPYRRRGTCCWRLLPCYDPYAAPSLRMSAEVRTQHAGTTYSTV